MSTAKKNLLVITNSFPDKEDKHAGGTFVKDQLKAVCSDFDEVHVVCPSTFGLGFEPREDFTDYKFANVNVHFLSYFNVPLFLRVFKGGFTYFMAGAIDRLMMRKGIGFSLIHAHFTWPSGAAAVRLKERYGVPVVVTEHTSLTLRKAFDSKDRQFLGTWEACDAVIRNREGDLKDFVSAGVSPDKLYYIPNGFDGAKFRPIDKTDCRKRLGLRQDAKILVSIGGLEEVKGHKHLIDAMAEVVKARQDVECHIIGKGELSHALRKKIDEMGLGGKVMLEGAQTHGSLPYWMNASDLVVHSSLSESGPMVMLEALGCGRPFIGTRVGAVPEVITSEDYGLVCRPGDAAALSKNILAALDRRWDSAKIVTHSKQYASEWVSKELLVLYAKLMERSSRVSP